ncbi:MAG: hypothetical protein IID45_03770 [Planctomycetes bacterium]|nr:hypothetical protein [Planctomycetota bacterium]
MMGKWWLVTFGTYGQWLPGDPRGFKTWRGHRYVPPTYGKNRFGEPTYDPDIFREEYQTAQRMVGDLVAFSMDHRRLVAYAISDDLESLPIVPSILAVTNLHVHLIAKFGGLKIRPSVGRFRSAATQKMHENGVIGERFWAKGCHMESLADEETFLQGFEYVKSHEQQGAVVKIWQLDYADDVLPF